jgi:integrase
MESVKMKSDQKQLDKQAKRTNNSISRRKPIMGQGLVNGLKLGKDGIYRFRIMVNGKVKTGSTDATSFPEAEKALTIIKADLLKEDKGTLIKKSPTFLKAVELWRVNKVGHVTDMYIKHFNSAMVHHFIPTLGTKFIDAITLQDIKACLQAYIIKTQAGKEIKSFGGYNQMITYVHSLFLEMKECNYIKTYKDKIPDYEDSQDKPKRVVEEEDFNKIIAAVDSESVVDNSTAIRMGLFLGLRSCEVVRAKWCCINWNTKEFRNLQTKGKESEVIPICDEMYDALLKLKKLRELATGEPVSPFGYIFCYQDGKPRLETFFRTALVRAGVSVLGHKLSSHDLRRSFITTLHKNGVPLDTIRKLARHRNIQTTMEYIQVSQNEKAVAINQVFNKKKA